MHAILLDDIVEWCWCLPWRSLFRWFGKGFIRLRRLSRVLDSFDVPWSTKKYRSFVIRESCDWVYTNISQVRRSWGLMIRTRQCRCIPITPYIVLPCFAELSKNCKHWSITPRFLQWTEFFPSLIVILTPKLHNMNLETSSAAQKLHKNPRESFPAHVVEIL